MKFIQNKFPITKYSAERLAKMKFKQFGFKNIKIIWQKPPAEFILENISTNISNKSSTEISNENSHKYFRKIKIKSKPLDYHAKIVCGNDFIKLFFVEDNLFDRYWFYFLLLHELSHAIEFKRNGTLIRNENDLFQKIYGNSPCHTISFAKICFELGISPIMENRENYNYSELFRGSIPHYVFAKIPEWESEKVACL